MRPSDSSRNQAGVEVLADHIGGSAPTKPRRRPKRPRGAPPNAERPSGPEMVATALPFETIPDEPLRAHFTRWLAHTLTGPAQEPARAEPTAEQTSALEARSERASPGPHTDADSPESSRTSTVPARVDAPHATFDASTGAPPTARDPAGAMPLAPRHLTAAGRPQYVGSRDGTVWVTKPILRSRGWTDAAVRDFLPEPEGLKPNPRFPVSGAPMQVWRPATVAAAEAGPEWREWRERSLRRRGTTLDALAETADEDFRARLETARAAIEAEGGPAPAAPEQ
ncbi:hypothetical protein K3N28_12995 [Glycomyces sp. TRM65418]|uniref:hypothetical protein n=1 Tax=Glycomyces sp. TRM65418 TaxID=2867006 RepID=UPI001D1601C1|nr:hypothetical protein [Glycomyces sp. TRM65418]MCC3763983.1 hypothetical protein [Glycomyces sp. TRM65418]